MLQNTRYNLNRFSGMFYIFLQISEFFIIFVGLNLLCMKRVISLLALLLWACTLNAQSDFTWTRNKDGKIIVLPKRPVFGLNLPKIDYEKLYLHSTHSLIEEQLRTFKPELQDEIQFHVGLEDRPMDRQVLSTAYQPFFNPYTPMLRQISPMALDFHEVSLVPIDEKLTFVTSGQQYTWPGVGGLTRINTGLTWNVDRWTFSGGAFAGRFFTPFNPSPQLTGGFNVMASYELTDWMTIRGWGQYAFYSNKEEKNPHMLLNPFYNHTSVGGAFEIKVNDSGFKVGVGVNYEVNPMNGKMNRQFLIYPAGKIGRISFGN